MTLDNYGLPTTKRGDGGDSARFAAFHGILSALTGKRAEGKFASESIDVLMPTSGVWIRNPNLDRWYSDPTTTSRDQLVAIMRDLSLHGKKKELLATFLKTISRFGFAQNIHRGFSQPGWKVPDFMLIEALEITIRGLNLWFLYPLLTALDLWYVGQAALICFPWRLGDDAFIPERRSGEDVDDDNHISFHLHAIKQLSTPISWLARKIYSKWRPRNLGNVWIGIDNNVLAARAWYGRNDTSELTELFKPLANQYFSK